MFAAWYIPKKTQGSVWTNDFVSRTLTMYTGRYCIDPKLELLTPKDHRETTADVQKIMQKQQQTLGIENATYTMYFLLRYQILNSQRMQRCTNQCTKLLTPLKTLDINILNLSSVHFATKSVCTYMVSLLYGKFFSAFPCSSKSVGTVLSLRLKARMSLKPKIKCFVLLLLQDCILLYSILFFACCNSSSDQQ